MAAPYTEIKVEIKSRLAVITLCRPKKKNAINGEMYTEIIRVLNELSNNDDVSITAITGTGDYYCSGTDLMSTINANTDNLDKSIEVASARLRKFLTAFIDHSKILVAVVNGPAIGIGVTTLGLCDIVYCSDTATFLTPFTKLGLSAEGCSTYTFPRIMGTAKANQMLLFNQVMNAQEALACGLVAQVYTKEQLNTVLWPQLAQYAEELPLKSLIYSKQLMRRFDGSKLHEAKRIECDQLDERYKSEDCMNAVMKFMNRRSKM